MSKKNNITILLVDDEEINVQNVGHFLEQQGFSVTTATSGEKALSLLNQSHFDLVITDLKMGDVDGVQVMKTAKELHPEIEVIIVTGYATVNSAVEAMDQGAFYYLPKPIKLKELHALVLRATEKTLLRREIGRLKLRIGAQQGTTQFIGQNPAILELKDSIAHFAQLDCNILITGETGTGKELVARTIYELSPRSEKRFLPINCGAMTEELMANELFGHEKDAYTDAGSLRNGLLESANGGVVLFDEIGEMPLIMQVKLLRVLQEKTIIRVGGNKEIPIDIRLLAATNRDLKEEVQKGTFRQDLYYRLNVINLHIPPLRDRKDDIPLLVNYFLAKYSLPNTETKNFSKEAMKRLLDHDYPGNARELENIIERSLAICDDSEIQPHHLPADIYGHKSFHLSHVDTEKPHISLEENERDYILSILKGVDGNKTKAAKIIGIDRVSLWRKLKKYEKNGIATE
ncbi:CheY-like receiver, AAA-type ATPase and DNA-binding domain-containing response regulator [Desulfocapsa sulfexigens DSM 10523]|uniref:CheY-like receiver, AAA-type ATPase and DNA-binding domain-containing response regulator n=1 Tax=Desulfocapsa sulfexigens (strain DSM 10523 / SB164P1) TaxID=1167006 RepID=M1PHS2_DESSD|nr:sigma-54 dependent transcriptional regulator [Desulfocapsa sulfexigens]AGF79150.1 CheY-like receiver, AAA-type ATPase and DNA-binding domain-containing response regulator [Desulfocapsa sulfexigens DSM 10523]